MNRTGKTWIFVSTVLACGLVLACGGYTAGYQTALKKCQAGVDSEQFLQMTGTPLSDKELENKGVENEGVENDAAGDDELFRLAAAMEKQQPQICYQDMDDRLLSFYTQPLQDSYAFYGRFSNTGHGYIHGRFTAEKSPIEDLSVSWETEDYNQRYVRLVSEQVQETGSGLEPVIALPGIKDIQWNEDRTWICLQIDQPEQAEIDGVFDRLVNRGQETYLEGLQENGAQSTAPVQGPFVQMRKWMNGMSAVEYVPLSQERAEELLGDEQKADLEQIDPFAIEVYANLEAKIDSMPMEAAWKESPISQALWDYLESQDLFHAERPENISGIKRIRIRQWNREQEILVEDEGTIREVERILQGSAFTDVSGCPYADLVYLEKQDGTSMALQFAADGCDGFILGDYACYTPGRAEWDRMRNLLGMELAVPADR